MGIQVVDCLMRRKWPTVVLKELYRAEADKDRPLHYRDVFLRVLFGGNTTFSERALTGALEVLVDLRLVERQADGRARSPYLLTPGGREVMVALRAVEEAAHAAAVQDSPDSDSYH